MEKLDDHVPQSKFIARLQYTEFSYVANANVPEHRFGTCFRGILVDTGAAKRRSADVNQHKAYCRHDGENPNIDNSEAAICHFGTGSAKSQGMETIKFIVGSL